MEQSHGRFAVESHHVDLTAAVEFVEGSRGAEAGVAHDEAQLSVFDGLFDGLQRPRLLVVVGATVNEAAPVAATKGSSFGRRTNDPAPLRAKRKKREA